MRLSPSSSLATECGSKATIANLGLSATPIFRPLNDIMNKAGPSGAPPSCADQVLARLCPILPAPPSPSSSSSTTTTTPRPTHARYTPAEFTIQLQPAVQLYRFSRSQEFNAIVRDLPQCFRPTESEETQMYEYLFKSLETQDVRRYYELKAQQLRREAYPESLTVLGHKATQRPPNNQSLYPSSVLYPSPVPSPGSLPKRGASTPSTPTPIRCAPSHASSLLSVPTTNADDGPIMPSLPKLNEYIVKEVLSKVQDQNGKRQSGFTPPNTPTKPNKARNQLDKAVAGRVKKEMSRLLATPLDPFMPLDVQGSMHSFGSSLDVTSALLSAPLQVPDMHLNQPSAENFMTADFANEYSMYFYNKGFGDAQASHGRLAQNALWMHSQQPPASMFLGSGPVFMAGTSTLESDGLSLNDFLSAGTPRVSVYDTSNDFLNSNPGVALDKARRLAVDRSLSDILGLVFVNLGFYFETFSMALSQNSSPKQPQPQQDFKDKKKDKTANSNPRLAWLVAAGGAQCD
ncbi:hypothetical protein HDU77_009715 [Chytriomyces hyalinus]|nr:hypothetical protein HDU77_009715 [Chytriomyces hyalinus]